MLRPNGLDVLSSLNSKFCPMTLSLIIQVFSCNALMLSVVILIIVILSVTLSECQGEVYSLC